jgi:hypothetical protein
MRKLFAFFASVLLISCLNEKNADPGVADTYIRYYSGGNNDQAQGFEETPDKGFIILANTRIQKAEADQPSFKIKLIKTDNNGNPTWIKLFPPVEVRDRNYVASHMQLLPSGGYVVVGDVIKSTGTKAFIMVVDENGTLVDSTSHGTVAAQLRGKAVAINSAGNFLVLSTSGPKTMFLAELNKTTLQPTNGQEITYEAGNTNLANRLFIDELGKVVWSGVVTKNTLTGIRMIKTVPNNVNTEFDLLISNPGFSEVATDFCRFGNAYAVIGSTNQKGAALGTDTDILFKRMAANGTVLSSTSYPFGDGSTPDGQNDVGNSISSTQDGGLILLSSVNSAALIAAGLGGRGDSDYYLIKINAFGDLVWFSSFGSKFKDDGVSVRQASDGGFAVLGTTTQGALKLVTLVKTDKSGKIE